MYYGQRRPPRKPWLQRQGEWWANNWWKVGLAIAAFFLWAMWVNNGHLIVTHHTNNTYYYCWDSGNLEPHHVGHPISGDHLCNDQELQDAGLYTP